MEVRYLDHWNLSPPFAFAARNGGMDMELENLTLAEIIARLRKLADDIRVQAQAGTSDEKAAA